MDQARGKATREPEAVRLWPGYDPDLGAVPGAPRASAHAAGAFNLRSWRSGTEPSGRRIRIAHNAGT